MKQREQRFIAKICGLTNETDAQWAVQCGATALGFNFYRQSPRYLEPERAAQISSMLPDDVLRVGIFVNTNAAELKSIMRAASLQVAQVHGALPTGALDGIRVWRSVPAGSTPSTTEDAELFLLDTPTRHYGGSGQMFDWTLTDKFDRPFIIAGGLDGANVAEAITTTRAIGVDACSRLETTPGKKDPSLVKEFLTNALRAAAQREMQEIVL